MAFGKAQSLLRSKRFIRLFALLLGTTLWGGLAPQAHAARFEEDDDVEVLYLGKWLPGTVIEVERRGVIVEFEFVGSSKREGFKKDNVRLACEAGAVAPFRLWSDSTGKYKIEAALVAIDGDTVKLRKKDMTELDVKMDRLNDSAKSYLKTLKKNMGSAVAGPAEVIPLEDFEMLGQFDTGKYSFSGSTLRVALTPDPLASHLTLKQGGAAFPQEDFFDSLGAVIPVGGSASWLLGSVEGGKPGDDTIPTRIVWVSLERKKVEKRMVLPPGERVLDYHAPSQQLLTCSTGGGSWIDGMPYLTVWKVTPKDEKPTPVVRWNSESEHLHGENGDWGRFIDKDTVLQQTKSQEFVAWDITKKEMRYRINQESFFAPTPVLSGGFKYLFMPEDKQVSIYDALTGELLSVLPSPNGSSAVAISDDGKQAAVLDRTSINVWDLTSADAPPEVFQAETIGTPFTATMAWLGDDRLIVDGRMNNMVLFSLKRRTSIWNYEFDLNAISKHFGKGRVREIVAVHLVFAASVRDGSQRGLAVGAVALPGPSVDSAESTLDRGAMLVMRPGSSVRIEVKTNEYDDQVRAVLEQKVEECGWVLDPSASNVLIAEMKQGEQQQVTYEFPGRSRASETVTFTPFIANLRLECNGKPAWANGTRTGAASMIRLREDQTAQEEVDKWQNPNPNFYNLVKIPSEIMDPKFRNGMGTTEVSNRGLIPKKSRTGFFP